MDRLFVSGLGLIAALLGWPAAAEAPPTVVGPPEAVFIWSSMRCDRWDSPDAPARAWRGADGRLRLIAGSERTRSSAGPSLDAVERDCAVLHEGAEADDPAAYDDRSWIAAIFADGAGRLEALAHVEYHGHLRPDRCPLGAYAACWANSIVQLSSTDGGARFDRDGPVFALPYPYDGAWGKRAGYFNPSNILRRGDHLYAFVFAEAYRAQRRGVCLLRRAVDGGAGDWRAWDGRDFAARFADPYREAVADPAAHVCAPLDGIASTVSSVVRGEDGLYLAVTPSALAGPDGAMRSGVYWMTSADLVTWSAPRLLFEAPLLWRRDCQAPAAYAYPSLIDADSADPSFGTADGAFWLYLVELPLGADCRVGPERNLIRLPVSWPPA